METLCETMFRLLANPKSAILWYLNNSVNGKFITLRVFLESNQVLSPFLFD